MPITARYWMRRSGYRGSGRSTYRERNANPRFFFSNKWFYVKNGHDLHICLPISLLRRSLNGKQGILQTVSYSLSEISSMEPKRGTRMQGLQAAQKDGTAVFLKAMVNNFNPLPPANRACLRMQKLGVESE